MNTFHLKLIAAAAMLLDHIAYFFPCSPVYFHWIGRISAPIFIFCVVNSMVYTHSQKKYLFRLYLSSVLMSFFQVISQVELNFLRTLFTIAVLIAIFEVRHRDKYLCMKYFTLYLLYQILVCFICAYYIQHSDADTESICFFLLPAVTGSVYTLEGGLVFVFLGLIFYRYFNRKKNMILSYVMFVLVYTLLQATYFIPVLLRRVNKLFPMLGSYIIDGAEYIMYNIIGISLPSFGGSIFFVHYQWMMLAALPAILVYSHKPGRNVKYVFYIFYPLHIILFWYLSNVM